MIKKRKIKAIISIIVTFVLLVSIPMTADAAGITGKAGLTGKIGIRIVSPTTESVYGLETEKKTIKEKSCVVKKGTDKQYITIKCKLTGVTKKNRKNITVKVSSSRTGYAKVGGSYKTIKGKNIKFDKKNGYYYITARIYPKKVGKAKKTTITVKVYNENKYQGKDRLSLYVGRNPVTCRVTYSDNSTLKYNKLGDNYYYVPVGRPVLIKASGAERVKFSYSKSYSKYAGIKRVAPKAYARKITGKKMGTISVAIKDKKTGYVRKIRFRFGFASKISGLKQNSSGKLELGKGKAFSVIVPAGSDIEKSKGISVTEKILSDGSKKVTVMGKASGTAKITITKDGTKEELSFKVTDADNPTENPPEEDNPAKPVNPTDNDNTETGLTFSVKNSDGSKLTKNSSGYYPVDKGSSIKLVVNKEVDFTASKEHLITITKTGKSNGKYVYRITADAKGKLTLSFADKNNPASEESIKISIKDTEQLPDEETGKTESLIVTVTDLEGNAIPKNSSNGYDIKVGDVINIRANISVEVYLSNENVASIKDLLGIDGWNITGEAEGQTIIEVVPDEDSGATKQSIKLSVASNQPPVETVDACRSRCSGCKKINVDLYICFNIYSSHDNYSRQDNQYFYKYCKKCGEIVYDPQNPDVDKRTNISLEEVQNHKCSEWKVNYRGVCIDCGEVVVDEYAGKGLWDEVYETAYGMLGSYYVKHSSENGGTHKSYTSQKFYTCMKCNKIVLDEANGIDYRKTHTCN